jgi:hypothetical protein
LLLAQRRGGRHLGASLAVPAIIVGAVAAQGLSAQSSVGATAITSHLDLAHTELAANSDTWHQLVWDLGTGDQGYQTLIGQVMPDQSRISSTLGSPRVMVLWSRIHARHAHRELPAADSLTESDDELAVGMWRGDADRGGSNVLTGASSSSSHPVVTTRYWGTIDSAAKAAAAAVGFVHQPTVADFEEAFRRRARRTAAGRLPRCSGGRARKATARLSRTRDEGDGAGPDDQRPQPLTTLAR